MHATCVDLTDVFGRGARAICARCAPRRARCSCRRPRDRRARLARPTAIPSHGAYRDYHHHTTHHHKPWAQRRLGLRPRARAGAGPRGRRGLRRPGARAAWPGGGLCVCALDTELLGHWWYEGIDWLRLVVEEARAGLSSSVSTTRSSASSRRRRRGELPVTTLGRRRATCRPGAGRRSPTWPSPRARPSCAWSPPGGAVGARALRELLALQASRLGVPDLTRRGGPLRARAPRWTPAPRSTRRWRREPTARFATSRRNLTARRCLLRRVPPCQPLVKSGRPAIGRRCRSSS